MNGKPSLKKTLSSLKRKKHYPIPEVIRVGSWIFEQDGNGDLILSNTETGRKIIVDRK